MTLTAPAPATAPPSARPRRRRWRRLAPAAGAVVAALVVAAYVLSPQLVWLGSTGAPEFGEGEVVSLPEFGEHGTDVVMHQHRGEVAVEATVSNDGLLPLTVVDARFSDDPRPLLAAVSATADGDSLPVTLWPGDSVELRVDGEMDNCRYYHEREAQVMRGLFVDGRVLGRETTESVAFAHDLVVRSPMIVDCPDRTLRRDDDTRR